MNDQKLGRRHWHKRLAGNGYSAFDNIEADLTPPPLVSLWYYAVVRCRSWLVLGPLVFLSVLQAQEDCPSGSRPDCPQAIAFFVEFQKAFRDNDRKKVASMISYPLLTNLSGTKVRIKGRTELLAHYDEVFDAEVRCAVLKATSNAVWGNWRGFTINLGEIWFDGIIPKGEKADANAPDFWTKYPFKIRTVNNGNPTSVCTKPQ